MSAVRGAVDGVAHVATDGAFARVGELVVEVALRVEAAQERVKEITGVVLPPVEKASQISMRLQAPNTKFPRKPRERHGVGRVQLAAFASTQRVQFFVQRLLVRKINWESRTSPHPKVTNERPRHRPVAVEHVLPQLGQRTGGGVGIANAFDGVRHTAGNSVSLQDHAPRPDGQRLDRPQLYAMLCKRRRTCQCIR